MKGLIDSVLTAESSRVMFTAGDMTITAGQIRAAAERAAGSLNSKQTEIYLHTSSAAKFVAGLLAAALKAKRVVLPAHTQASYLGEIGCDPAQLLDDNAFDLSGADASNILAFNAAARDLDLVFFTSGSTGAPKPVPKSLSRLEIEARALDSVWRAEARHVRATVSHQHIYGLLFRIFWPVMSGRTSDDTAALYWEELGGKLGDGVTLISSPAHLTRLPPHQGFFAQTPKLVFSSGQALPFEAAQACAFAMDEYPIEVLGSTETGGIGWRRQREQGAAWTPFSNILVSADENDLLEVCSPYLPDDAPYQTGDGVEILNDGRFKLKPRGDRVEKIEGKRVSLTRVEAALRALTEIADASTLSLPARKTALAAIVVLTPAGADTLKNLGAFRFSRELRHKLSETLEPSERPKHWRFVDAIPTDSQGKRVLSTLRALFDENG
ncbi:MAG: AMP-binding protein [Caulobacterales bacterium]